MILPAGVAQDPREPVSAPAVRRATYDFCEPERSEAATVANKISLTWTEELRFEGRSDGGMVAIDGNGMHGTTPVDLLLEAVAACTAADVVDILKKGRQELRSMTVECTGERRDDAPKYVKRLQLVFRIAGDVDEVKAQRAVDLSLEKYCSVFHSLRMDLGVDTEIHIES